MAVFCVSFVGRGALAIAVLAVAACSQSPEPAATDRAVTPAYNAETGRLEEITYDRNGDGEVDARLFMNGTVAVRAELDDDFDGKVDRREHFAAPAGDAPAGTTENRRIERVELSTRGDGLLNRTEYFDAGVIARAEEDADGDGRVDKWETWRGGELAMVALDTRGRGRPDRRLVHLSDGGIRLEVDPEGTGTFVPAGTP